jgi:capsular polysaccharide biosynthesis protein
VDLTHAAQRILRGHALIILGSLLAGIMAALLVTSGAPTYSASARVSLGKKVPSVDSEAAALASTARGIATSQTVIVQALRDAKLRRDATQVANNDVSVSALGTSNIVAVTVQDGNAVAAARLANALASELGHTFLQTMQGQSPQVVGNLDAEVSQLSSQLASIDTQIQAAGSVVIPKGGTDPVTPLLDQRDALSRQITALESQRDQIVANDVASTQASVVSTAPVPAQPDSSGRGPALALGALLGLVLGVGVSAIAEALHPTLRGETAVVDAVGAPRLGRLPRPLEQGSDTPRGVREIGARVGIAASAIGVDVVELLPIPNRDLGRLASALQGSMDGHVATDPEPSLVDAPVLQGAGSGASKPPGPYRPARGSDGPRRGSARGATAAQGYRTHCRVRQFGWDTPPIGEPGIVVVAADRVAESQLAVLDDVAITGWPIVGVVTYPVEHRRDAVARRFAHPARERLRRLRERGGGS